MTHGFFTRNENIWLINGYLEDFMKFDRGEKLQDGDTTVSMMDHFLGMVIRDFDRSFPYRNPDADRTTLNKDQLKRQCTRGQWNGLRERFRNRFNHLKSRYNAGKIEIGSSTIESSTAAGPAPLYERSGSMPLSDSGELEQQPGSADTTSAPYEDDYAVAIPLLNSWQLSLNELADYCLKRWADCDASEIERRQEAAPRILRDVLSILTRSTGCEVMAIGVTATDVKHEVFRCATSRSLPYLQTPECLEARNSYVHYINDALGSSLCANKDCPGPTVCPNPERGNRPICPRESSSDAANCRNLLDYFSCQLQWQGGGADVPYDRIQVDGETQTYALVHQDVMPEGYSVMRNPLAMQPDERRSWITHLRAGDQEEIPADIRFQFAEPRPGVRFDDPLVRRPAHSDVNYEAPAWAYGCYLSRLAESEPPQRKDGLPFAADTTPYLSIVQMTIDQMTDELPPDDHAFRLVDAIDEHDRNYPAEAGLDHWKTNSSEMPHIRDEPPDSDAGTEHFMPGDLWFDIDLLDYTSPRHFKCSITAIAAWCDPQRWTHRASGTLFGGRLGVKWPVLIIILLRINIVRYAKAPGDFVKRYGSDAHGFIDRDFKAVDFALLKIETALRHSTALLSASLPSRQVQDLESRAQDGILQAHAGLPFPRDTEPDYDRIERWIDDPWTQLPPQDENMSVDDLDDYPSEQGAEDESPVAAPTKRPLSRGAASPPKRRTRRNAIVSDEADSESAKSQSPAQAMSQLDISMEEKDIPTSRRVAGPATAGQSRRGIQ